MASHDAAVSAFAHDRHRRSPESRHDAALRVHGQASALLGSGREGSGLLLEASTSVDSVVPFAIPNALACRLAARTRARGLAVLFANSKRASKDAEGVAECPGHRALARPRFACLFPLSA